MIYSALKQVKFVLWIFLLSAILVSMAKGQAHKSVYNDVARQRLLIRIITDYVHTISQGQIDMDSAARISCRLYGFSPLLVYNEGYSDGKPTEGTRLLDAGKIKDAEGLVNRLHGEDRMQLTIDLGNFFVFKPGALKADLDKAFKYTQMAIYLSKSRSVQWQIEAMQLQAYVFDQSGKTMKSQQLSEAVIKLCEQSGRRTYMAQALLNAGRLLPYGHPSRLKDFEKALAIFREGNATTKEIETLSEMNVEYFVLKQYKTVERVVRTLIKLQSEIAFRQQQYAYDVLTYLAYRQGDLTGAISFSDKSLAHLKSKEDSVFESFFFARKGLLYARLAYYNKALIWFNKALENKSGETRLYWYKAFLAKADLLNSNDKPKEALSLLKKTGGQYPPLTIFEKMYFAISLGEAYDRLKQLGLAENNYTVFLKMAEHFPVEYIHDEFPEAFYKISSFYRLNGKTGKARAVLERARVSSSHTEMEKRGLFYHNLFKIDSAEKDYLHAIENLQLGQKFSDSAFSYEQRKKVTELLVKYEAEQKDKNIELLNSQHQLHLTNALEAIRLKNITLGGAILLLIIIGLLFNYYLIKQRTNKKLEVSQKELDQKNTFLETLNTEQEKLLKEKEWLIKEVHHRVKNNLQMVTSLLYSQSVYLDDDAAKLAIKDSLRRMQAMSLIHQKLYQDENISTIAMPEYISDLVRYLDDSFQTDNQINFEQVVEALELDVSQAIPLGLIITESIVNAIKYAFLNGQKGTVTISLQQENASYLLLKISDNGIGFPSGLDTRKHNSLGLDLMQGLTKQLNGSFYIEDNNGVHISIRFKILNK